MSPYISYLCYGYIYYSNGNAIYPATLKVKTSIASKYYTADSDGIYMFDLADIGYVDGETITIEVTEPYNNEYISQSIVVSGVSNNENITLAQRTSADAEITSYAPRTILHSVGNKPITDNNEVPMKMPSITDDNEFPVKLPSTTPTNPLSVKTLFGVPNTYTKQSANSDSFLINKGNLNKLRLRPRILNEHVESSSTLQATVTATNIVGQIFKASSNNINGIHIAGESAESTVFDNFESYADSAALQVEWVETTNAAELETTIVTESTKSMKLPMDTRGDEWVRTVSSTDYTDYTGHIHVYQDKEYNRCKLRFFVGDGTNTASLPLLAIEKNIWYNLSINMDALTDDQAGVTDLTAITKVGFRVENAEGGKFAYIDHMTAIAPPGSIKVKLWDMGTTLPTISNSIDDGTQYTTLGDLGITGVQVSDIEVELLGGLRVYAVKDFVAGAAIGVTGNVLLTPNNYYALTINYVDTEFSLYGRDDCGTGIACYNNGFAFEAADEATNITKVGTTNNLNFAIFSVQDIYMINSRQYLNAVPGDNSTFTLYTKTTNYERFNTLVASAAGRQTLQLTDLKVLPPFIEKGGMLKEEYNDDYTDSVSSIFLGMRYLYEPPNTNG